MKIKKQNFKIFNFYNSEEKINSLISLGIDFTTTETKNTTKINYILNNKKLVYMFAENCKSQRFLIYLNKIKAEIRENEKNVISSSFSDNIQKIDYFNFSDAIYKASEEEGIIYTLNNVIEADISHAYYRSAFIQGFISKALYLDILKNCSKNERLHLLGAIASVKVKTTYIEGKEASTEIVKDDFLRSAWFKIASGVDEAMKTFKKLLENYFLFYWVDGIYFKDTGINFDFYKNKGLLELNLDFQFKITPLKMFELSNLGEYLQIRVQKPEGKIKVFNPAKREIKFYNFD